MQMQVSGQVGSHQMENIGRVSSSVQYTLYNCNVYLIVFSNFLRDISCQVEYLKVGHGSA